MHTLNECNDRFSREDDGDSRDRMAYVWIADGLTIHLDGVKCGSERFISQSLFYRLDARLDKSDRMLALSLWLMPLVRTNIGVRKTKSEERACVNSINATSAPCPDTSSTSCQHVVIVDGPALPWLVQFPVPTLLQVLWVFMLLSAAITGI